MQKPKYTEQNTTRIEIDGEKRFSIEIRQRDGKPLTREEQASRMEEALRKIGFEARVRPGV